MPVFKNEDNGTWYVMVRYVNWKGERKQKCKRVSPQRKKRRNGSECFNSKIRLTSI